MRAFRFAFVTMMLAMIAWAMPATAQGDPVNDPPPHLKIALVAETSTPRAGSTINLALDARPQPGWQGYWQNPGDAGFPAKSKWTLRAGAAAGEPRYPAPQQLIVAGLMNYVFERPYAVIVPLTLPSGLAVGSKLPVKLHLQYLVCTRTLCVPEQADLAAELTVGDGHPDTALAGQFAQWMRALAQPLGSRATWQAQGGALRIAIPYPASAAGAGAYFYPTTAGAID
jgi:DsbC/DsbD-like thiol-disulfide interchange protein